MKRDKVVAIIQARIASTRLPGKVLERVNGKSILEVLISRVKRSRWIDSLVVATTENKDDDRIVEVARKLGVEWYRGSEEDVLKRFVDAARRVKAEVIVRITADNPLTDPELMDRLIEVHLESQADYTHCVGVPLGISVEVVNEKILEKISSVAKDTKYREHVTLYVVDHPELFKIHTVTVEEPSLNYPNFRLTIDTEEDLELMKKLRENLGDLGKLDTKEVIKFLGSHPEMAEINAHIQQKMPRSNKKVTVIIRTFNSGKFVRNTIESALKQDAPSDLYELLLVDNGSTDNTKEILESYGDRLRVVGLERRGYVSALNCGIANAEGEYIILLDADDTFEPTIILEMSNILENEGEVGFVYCDYYEKAVETKETKVVSLRENIFNCVAGGIMSRKKILTEVGMYDESLIFPEYDLLIKVMRKHKGKYISHPLFTYHRHGDSLTANRERIKIGREQLFSKYGVIEGLRDY